MRSMPARRRALRRPASPPCGAPAAHDRRLPGRAAVDADELELRRDVLLLLPEATGQARASGAQPAVDDHGFPGHEARLVARQEKRSGGDVLGFARLRPWLQVLQPFARGLLVAAMEQRCDDAARTDGVHPDPVLGQLHRRAARQVDDGGLARGVSRRARTAAERGDGGGVQDHAALPLLLHRTGPVLDAEEHAAHEHAEGVVPILDAGLRQRSECAPDAGVVEEHVDAAELRRGAGDQRFDVGLRRDVDPLERDPPLVPGLVGEREGVLRGAFVQVADDDACAFVEKRSALARPMPLPPPVITATLSASRATAAKLPQHSRAKWSRATRSDSHSWQPASARAAPRRTRRRPDG